MASSQQVRKHARNETQRGRIMEKLTKAQEKILNMLPDNRYFLVHELPFRTNRLTMVALANKGFIKIIYYRYNLKTNDYVRNIDGTLKLYEQKDNAPALLGSHFAYKKTPTAPIWHYDI